jgi:ABC-type Fe3+/spermidine/putrescine transport system ATPase subunit
MHQGKIIQIGTPKQLYLQPSTLFAARYFSALNEIPAQRLDHQIKTIFGHIALPENLAYAEKSISCCFRPHQVQVCREPVKMLPQQKSFHPVLWVTLTSYICNLLLSRPFYWLKLTISSIF